MEIRTLLPEELDAWAIHCETVFQGAGREYFLRHYHNDPWRDINGIFVAVEAGQITATVRVFRRQVWLGGQAVPMGGIGEVSTKEAYRGRGLSGELLQRAIGYMQREGMQVSVLYTGLHGHYERYGWRRIPRAERRFIGAQGVPCECREGTPEDLTAIRALAQRVEPGDWSVVRENDEYWHKWMAAEIARKKMLVATAQGRLEAWLAYTLHGDSWEVVECGCEPGREGLFDGLCAATAMREGRESQPFTAPAWLPTAATNTELHANEYSMIRLVAPFEWQGEAINTTQALAARWGQCRGSELDSF